MNARIVGLSLVLPLLLSSASCGGGDGGGGGGGITTPPPPQTGTISGTVTAAGAGVAGASVALGSTTQTSNASGQFTFASVAAGTHSLMLTAPAGFELDAGQTAQRSVTVAGGQTASVSWALRATSGGSTPRTVEVQMSASSFDPSDINIAPGSTVRWINATPTSHTITPGNASQAGVWANQNIPAQNGFVFAHTFNTAGTFNYACNLHGGMTGTVRVQ